MTLRMDIIAGSIAAVQQRTNVSLAESFLSVDAIIIVDVSGSMAAHDAPGERSRYVAACEELALLQAELPGRIAVIAFSDRAQFCPGGVPPLMGEGTDMVAALRFVKPADGLGIRIILISDGEPDEPEDTLRVARQFRSHIDTVYIGSERGRGRDFLAILSGATGGQHLESIKPAMLAEPVRNLLAAEV